jgi:N4-gp56 family major capsid protein
LTRKWRRYSSLPRATAPLADGVPPTGHKLTHTDVTATLEFYGDVVKITNTVSDTHEDPVLDEAMTVCGEQAAETVEEIRINFLKAGTNVFYANNVSARTSVNSPAVRGDFRRIYRHFKNYKAREISSIIRASALVSTEPVASAYFVMGHTDLDADLRGLSGFIPAEQYSNSTRMLPGEIGKLDQFRIILTAMFDPWLTSGASGTTYLSGGVEVSSAASCDVYPMIFVARNSYAIVPLQGYNSASVHVMNPGRATKDDPLGQIGFVSWGTWQTGAILNQNWLARLEVAATAVPS